MMNCTCPKCTTECEYDDEAAGFAIECKKCGRIFITPSAEQKEKEAVPLLPPGGFYRAVFIDTWKIFVRPHNYILIGLLIAMAVFKFFLAGELCADQLREKMLAHAYIAGMSLKILLWGWFAGIYFNIIHDTAYGLDDLTDEVDDAITAMTTAFLASIGRPILLFYYAVAGSLMPLLVGMTILALVGEPAAILGIFLHVLIIVLFVGSLFLFPAAILTVAVTEDILSMRPDYFLKPIVSAFCPYLIVAAFTAAAGVYWYYVGDLDAVANESQFRIAFELLLNIGFQFFVIIAMRTIGLYYRHYHRYFSW
ncbi:MAG: hypothetical protein Q7T18_04975 [Sedimentisphaerales bacterium]|nr:hypothetical protein [Sedimentisphaerales bacterium]